MTRIILSRPPHPKGGIAKLDREQLEALQESAESDRTIASKLKPDAPVADLLRRVAEKKDEILAKRDYPLMGIMLPFWLLLSSASSLT